MTTVVLQLAQTLFTLCFGVLGMVVARHRGMPRVHRLAWTLTGVAFTVTGAHAVAQASFAAVAFTAGPGSPAWNTYLRWMPAGNDGRAFAVMGFGVALLYFVARGAAREPRPPWSYAAALVACLLAGSWVGLAEGPFTPAMHFPVLTVIDAVALITLLAALWLAAVHDTVDFLLWVALACYAAQEAVSVDLHYLASWLGTAGALHLWPGMPHAIGTATFAVMIGCALRRLLLARRGAQVPALFHVFRGGTGGASAVPDAYPRIGRP